MRSLLQSLRGLWRIHIDIPAIVFIILVIILINQQGTQVLVGIVDKFADQTAVPTWMNEITIGVVANILALIIIVPALVWALGLLNKSFLCGEFTAYEITERDGERIEERWGTVHLTYNLFSHRIKGRLIAQDEDAEIYLEAKFDRGEYLRGHYIESRFRIRRRLGAFLLLLDGTGHSYTGRYVYVDPREENSRPQTGEARWVRNT